MTAKRKGLSKPRPWRRDDVRLMRKLARDRRSAREAAPMLRRTVGSVKYAAMVRGVHFRAINQPPGVQRRPEQRAKLARLRRARARKARAA